MDRFPLLNYVRRSMQITALILVLIGSLVGIIAPYWQQIYYFQTYSAYGYAQVPPIPPPDMFLRIGVFLAVFLISFVLSFPFLAASEAMKLIQFIENHLYHLRLSANQADTFDDMTHFDPASQGASRFDDFLRGPLALITQFDNADASNSKPTTTPRRVMPKIENPTDEFPPIVDVPDEDETIGSYEGILDRTNPVPSMANPVSTPIQVAVPPSKPSSVIASQTYDDALQLFKVGKYSMAGKKFVEVAKLEPLFAPAYFHAAECCKALGNTEGSEKWMERYNQLSSQMK